MCRISLVALTFSNLSVNSSVINGAIRGNCSLCSLILFLFHLVFSFSLLKLTYHEIIELVLVPKLLAC